MQRIAPIFSKSTHEGAYVRVCFDVNTVIDILGRTDAFPESLIAYDVACVRRFDVVLPALATPTVDYVLHTYGYEQASSTDAVSAMLELFDVVDVTANDCRRARRNGMQDYEDALIAESALRNGADIIVTRDNRDFRKAPLKAMTPQQFVDTFKPENYDYDVVVVG